MFNSNSCHLIMGPWRKHQHGTKDGNLLRRQSCRRQSSAVLSCDYVRFNENNVASSHLVPASILCRYPGLDISRYLPRNHLVSVVSMLGPSPDWIVGASALEMCLANCTWLDNKVANRAQCCIHTTKVQSSAANQLIGEVVQSRRRPLLGPSPG